MGEEKSEPVAETAAAWAAYQAWLTAAKAATGEDTWAALGRELSRREVARLRASVGQLPASRRMQAQAEMDALAAATANWTGSGAGNRVRNWHNRPNPPQEPVLARALVRVVTRLVPVVPHTVGRWEDFALLLSHVVFLREQTGQRGAAAVQRDAVDSELRGLSRLLACVPASAGSLDPLELGLGSWAFNGSLPSYVARTVDDQLRDAIADPDRSLVVAVGPPKSGKTRSVFEALRQVLPTAKVWWLNPGPKALPALAEIVHREATRNLKDGEDRRVPDVVVVDDLQRCGVNPVDGLSQAVLDLLTRHVKVVGTLHFDDLTRWTNGTIDHRSNDMYELDRSDPIRTLRDGVTRGLVDRLTAASIQYAAPLNPDEESTAVDVMQSAHGLRIDLDLKEALLGSGGRLAEWFAAVEQLHRRAEGAMAAGGYPGAIVAAAVDATNLYPDGASVDQLLQLARWHYTKVAPTRLWSGSGFERAVDWATQPLGGPGSPHALLQALVGDESRLRLMDRLEERLSPTEGWTPDHLTAHLDELDPAACRRAAMVSQEAGSGAVAHTWYLSAAERGEVAAMVNLGVLAHTAGDLLEARRWYCDAIAGCDSADKTALATAKFDLSLIAASEGDPEEEQRLLQEAAELDYPTALWNLSAKAFRTGDAEASRVYRERAAEAGATWVMVHLASEARENGDMAAAEAWWTRAAAKGDATALHNLAVLAANRHHDLQARQLHERAARLGDASSMNQLGLRALHDDADEAAERWFRQAFEAGFAHAAWNLGQLLGKIKGDRAAAKAWFLRGAEAGSPRAMYEIATHLIYDGDRAGGLTWALRAAEQDDRDAAFLLGLDAKERGDDAIATTWLEKAQTAGHSRAALNLGIVKWNRGEVGLARRWFIVGADAGDGECLNTLGALELGAGNKADAQHWLTEAAKSGSTEAMCNLGAIAEDLGDITTAREWYLKASDAGSTRADFYLGLLSRPDPVEAERWFARAAAEGHADATCNLGVIAEHRGDTERAAQWYRQAADLNHLAGMRELGRLLALSGDEEGIDWLERAAADGDEAAGQSLSAIQKALEDLDE